MSHLLMAETFTFFTPEEHTESGMAALGTCLGCLISPVVFIAFPPKEDVFLLHLGVPACTKTVFKSQKQYLSLKGLAIISKIISSRISHGVKTEHCHIYYSVFK